MSFKSTLLNLLKDGAVRRAICSISSACSGSPGSAVWGDISGNITSQTDLQTALDEKVTTPDPLIPGVVLGTTLSTSDLGLVGYSQEPLGDQLAMYTFEGTLKSNAPTESDDVATKDYVDNLDLQAVTTGAGNNITPNAIQITGLENLDMNTDGLALVNQGDISQIVTLSGGALTSSIAMGKDGLGDSVMTLTTGTSSLNVREETISNSSVLVSGRIEMDAGINPDDGVTMSQLAGYIPTSEIGVASGVVPLNSSSKIDQTYLPSYVDDVLEYPSLVQFPLTGVDSIIYVAQDTNRTYRWSGSAYIQLNEGTVLGETSSTAYRGDRGKTAYDHSQLTDGTNPHATTFANITSKPTTISGYGITDNILVQGGNNFGATVQVGATSNNAVQILTNNAVVATFPATGGFSVSNNNFANATSSNNSLLNIGTNGLVLSRNIADANTVAKFNHINASSTGLIADFQKAGTSLTSIANSGKITTVEDIEITALSKGLIIKSPDGTRYRIVVANGGALSTIPA